MFPDFTQNIPLNKRDQRIYKIIRAALYISALFTVAYMLFRILFPTQYFYFSFQKSSLEKNTLIPRQENGENVSDGNISSGQKIYFSAALNGIYSKAIVRFNADNEESNTLGGAIQVKKSYQAFLYPEEAPLGFKDGTLVRNQENYYIVSKGELRKFTGNSTESLGLRRESFWEASGQELEYNVRGADITPGSEYPDAALFKIDEAYYMLQNKTLRRFVSTSAFESQHDSDQAIEKSEDFMKNYELSEDVIGFSDGSLISYGESAYAVSQGNIFPINNPVTFKAMGYAWEDILPVNGDEFSLYKKEKMLNIGSAHPHGTIFYAPDNPAGPVWYMVQNNRKRRLASSAIANSWLKKSPIVASIKSLDVMNRCIIETSENFFAWHACKIPVKNMQSLTGKDYEFEVTFDEAAKLDSMDIKFKKEINWSNLKSSLRTLFNRVIINYAGKL